MPIGKKVAEAAAFLRKRGLGGVERVLVTETTLGGFSGVLDDVVTVPFRKVPHFREPGLGGWPGAILAGDLGGVATVVVEGRVHLYEGFLPGETALPLRVLAALGARRALLLAEGRALREDLAPGCFMLVADRLDLTGAPALKGVRDSSGRACFEAPAPAPEAARRAAAAAAASGAACAAGVAALVHGPVWPSPAEVRMLRGFGADAVAMALAPEIDTATCIGLEATALLRIGSAGWGAQDVAFCTALLGAC